MKHRFAVLFVIAILVLTAVPAFAADTVPQPVAHPAQFNLWGTVSGINATAGTFDVTVSVYRAMPPHGTPPASVTVTVRDTTRFWERTDTGLVPAAFSDLEVGQAVRANGLRTHQNYFAKVVVINADVPPQHFAILGKITAKGSSDFTVEVRRARPASLGLDPGEPATITVNSDTRFCLKTGPRTCTPITFADLVVDDWVMSTGVVQNQTLVARHVTKLPGEPPQ